MSIILLFLYIIIIIAGVCFPKARVLFYIEFVLAWFLIAGNYDNADYANYLHRYDMGKEVLLDAGFSVLCYFFDTLGFDYQGFKSILSLLCLLLVFRTIKKVSLRPAFIGSLFLLFPFILDVIQFRNFVAYSIVFAGIPYLYETGIKNAIKYVIIVIIATSIHFSAIFYLLFLLSKIRLKSWHIALGILMVFVAKEFFKAFFSDYLDTDKLEFFDSPSKLGALFGSFVIIMNCIIIYYVYKSKKKCMITSNKDFFTMRFNAGNMWLLCNVLLVFIIPFLLDNGNYYRIFRNIIILNMAYIDNATYLRKNKRILIIAGYYLYFVVSNYFMGDYYEVVFKPVFTFNSIIS